MAVSKQFPVGFAIAAIASFIVPGFSAAVQLGDGSTAFAHPPTLVKAATTNSNTYSWSSIYYYTVSVPEDSGEPLQRLTITQTEGFDRDLTFDLKRSYAFEGVFSRRKTPANLAIADIQFNPKKNQVTVMFNPPISPGKTVTVSLEPYQNPATSGVYLFDVTAFPPGEKPRGQFLGFGRITFYSGGVSFRR